MSFCPHIPSLLGTYRPPPALQDERQRALRSGLDSINREIESAARKDVAIWFPMGACNERVLRIAAKEAVLLNSREKVKRLSLGLTELKAAYTFCQILRLNKYLDSVIILVHEEGITLAYFLCLLFPTKHICSAIVVPLPGALYAVCRGATDRG